MKVLIVDDESKARRVVKKLLGDLKPEIKRFYQAEDLIKGVEIINRCDPDIVFLDIEMPQHSGLDIGKFIDLESANFQLIFITAYNQYAIEAFKVSAIDYILKPISRSDLLRALNKASHYLNANKKNFSKKDLQDTIEQISQKKIAIEVPNGVKFLSYADILFFEADGMYTVIHFKENSKETICKPLKFFEKQLYANPSFYRTHRSFVVNLRHIRELVRKDGFYLVLDSEKVIPVAKNRQEDFLQIVSKFY